MLRAAVATLGRASRAYWVIQALTAAVAIASGLVLAASDPGGWKAGSEAQVLRAVCGAALFFAVTHAGIRPLLKIVFAQPRRSVAAWFGLVLWLVLMSAVAYGGSRVLNAIFLGEGTREVAAEPRAVSWTRPRA